MKVLSAGLLVALLQDEIDHADRRDLLAERDCVVDPVSAFEAAARLERRYSIGGEEAWAFVRDLTVEADIKVVPIDLATAEEAFRLYARARKGRFPVGVNLAECFAQATAERIGGAVTYFDKDPAAAFGDDGADRG